MDKAFECVVAHYNEDLSWLEPLSSETIVYSKGRPPCMVDCWRDVQLLPNIGREAHTYLHHIVECYEHLAENTLFVQGNVHNSDGKTPPHTDLSAAKMKAEALDNTDRSCGFMAFTSQIIEFKEWGGLPWQDCSSHAWWYYKNGQNMAKAEMTPAEFWMKFFKVPHPRSVYYVSGSVFAVNATKIRSRPRHFYEELRSVFTGLNHINPEYGHFMERFWGSIFLDQPGEANEGSRDDCSKVSGTLGLKQRATSSSTSVIDEREFGERHLQSRLNGP
ncbi:hypothetical protein BP5796_09844 [Coleophoma crateriformis]|uniref:Uncharacterized protein n=1 Tax=Coleophoma crateriformis TaxID=565419 RepID=A0A3D8QTQ8_9HELO|nr:hypothetical protein BP5796_09844 [Coleophoma crateriformis]